jgi:microsomal dipeptidase-like Zn-dependent dipeptidase
VTAPAVAQPDTVADARRLHADAIVVDTHCDTLGRVLEGRWRIGERSEEGQFDLVRAREGGLTAEVLATFVSHQRHGDPLRQSSDAGGLSAFGRDLVRECGRLGILLDVSHLAPKGVADVLERSGRPVVATHANAYAVHAHPRNLTDEQLDGIAASGGGGRGGARATLPGALRGASASRTAPEAPRPPHRGARRRSRRHRHGFRRRRRHAHRGRRGRQPAADADRGDAAHGYAPERITKALGANFLRVFDEVFDG